MTVLCLSAATAMAQLPPVPVLTIAKTAMLSGGTCGVDDVETLTITPPAAVVYCYEVPNLGTGPALNVVVVDDNGTPLDGTDDFVITLTGLTDEDTDTALDDLAAGASATGQSGPITITTAPVTNTAEVTADGLVAIDVAMVLPPVPVLIIAKTVTTEFGTCGVDGFETLTSTEPVTVKYCYEVSNPGTGTALDVEVIDDNGTPLSGADDFVVTLSGLADLDGEGDLGDLAAGGTAIGEVLVAQTTAGTVVNTATASSSDPNIPDVTDLATVIVQDLVPLLNLEKTVTTAGGTCGVDDVEVLTVTAPATVKYCYEVSNLGTDILFDIEVIDDGGTPGDLTDDFMVTLSGLSGLGNLIVGGTATGEALVALTTAGTVVNTGLATSPIGPILLVATNPATVNVQDPGAGVPQLNLEKTVTTAGGTCGVDDVEVLTVTAPATVKYCYEISNPGTGTLFDVEVIDDNGTPGDLTDDFMVPLSGLADLDGEGDLGDLAAGGTASGEAVVVLTTAGTVVNTATATSTSGLTATDPATVMIVTAGPLCPNPPVGGEDLSTILTNPSFEDDLVHSGWTATMPNPTYQLSAPQVNPVIIPKGEVTALVAPVGNNFIGIVNIGDNNINGKLVHEVVTESHVQGTIFKVTVVANRGRLEPGANTPTFGSGASTLAVKFLGWGAGAVPVIDPNSDDWSRVPSVQIIQVFTDWAANGQWAAQTFQFVTTVDLEYLSFSLAGVNHKHDSYVAFDIEFCPTVPGGAPLQAPLPSPTAQVQVCNGLIPSLGCTVNGVAGSACAGTSGDDTIVGSNVADVIFSYEGHDLIDGLDGADVICSGPGNDSIEAGEGEDLIDAGDGHNVINAGEGDNVIVAGSGNDNITAGSGNDIIEAGDGSNTISAGEGNNEIVAGTGSDNITAGAGHDSVMVVAGHNLISAGDGLNEVITGVGSDNITTGAAADNIDAGDGHNQVAAGAGNDVIVAGLGNDTIDGGLNVDTCDGGSGFNVVSNCEDSALCGNGLLDPGEECDDGNSVDGDGCTAGCQSETSQQVTTVDCTTGPATTGCTVNGQAGQECIGTVGHDTIVGTAGNDVILGLGGHDTIRGQGGNDFICGGAGSDTLTTLDGADTIDGGAGNNLINAGGGPDTIVAGTGSDNINGGGGDDIIDGGDGHNYLLGGDGEDTITAGTGNDNIDGGTGTDVCDGGTGYNAISNCP